MTSDDERMNQRNENVTLPPDPTAETIKREGGIGLSSEGHTFITYIYVPQAERWPLLQYCNIIFFLTLVLRTP